MRKPYNRAGLRTWFLIVGLIGALAGYATPLTLTAGAVLVVLSLFMFFWSKGCLHKKQEVTQTGPYRFIRHPFYLGNIILDAGIVIMSGFWLLILIAPAWWLLVYIPVMRREEKTLTSLFGDEYRRYKARVPMLIPWRRPLPLTQRGFDWLSPNIVKMEMPRAIRFTIYPLLFIVAWRLANHGMDVLLSPAYPDLLVMTGIISAAVARLIWMHHFKHYPQNRPTRPLLPAQLLQPEVRLILIMAIMVLGTMWEAVDVVDRHWIHWVPGITLLAVSMLALNYFRRVPLLSEGALAAGIAMLFELELIGLLLIPAYLAVLLDHRLRTAHAGQVHEGAMQRSFSLPGYRMITVIGLVAAIAVELWIQAPYYASGF